LAAHLKIFALPQSCALFRDNFNSIRAVQHERWVEGNLAMRRWMKPCFGSFLFLMLVPNALFGAEADYSNIPTAALIDELAGLDRPAPGIAGLVRYEGFMAEDQLPGVLRVPPPEIPPAMRELVRRGVAALPVLIQHLDDRRATKIVFDTPPFKLMGRDYDPRKPVSPKNVVLKDRNYTSSDYTVKIADVCYVLIGQIVNRNLVAVRYQDTVRHHARQVSPLTSALVVNSPIEEPTLIARVKSDWDGLDGRSHEESLVSDIKIQRNQPRVKAALQRLRYYYPERYARLDGQDLLRRQEFEAEESGYASQAFAYSNNNEHAKAAEEWSKWIKIAPHSPMGYWRRSSEFAKSDRLDEALEDLSRAVELETDPYWLGLMLRERASAYHLKGMDDRATADYEELIRLSPKDARSYVRLGIFLDDREQHEVAIKAYNQALELDPNYAQGFECRGIAHQRLGNAGKALADFNKALELNPKAADAYNCREWASITLVDAYNKQAWKLMTAEHLDEALANVKKAISLDPKSAMIMGTRAHIFLAMNKTQDAISDFNAAIQAGTNPATFCGRGKAYERLGLVDLAIADFKRCLELPPEHLIDRQAQEQANAKLKTLTAPQPSSESASPPR
jgi:tetratricopeptide (TPR) repeat protein